MLKRASKLAPMSSKRRKELADMGIAFPSSTLLPKVPKLAAPKAKGRKDTGFDAATAEAILERDGWSCSRCGGALHGARGWDYSIQHRRARGAGGSLRPDTNAPQNGLALCGSATSAGGCHRWVESHRAEAREHGWAIRQCDDPLLIPVVHALHGTVFLHSNGSWGSRPETADSGDIRHTPRRPPMSTPEAAVDSVNTQDPFEPVVFVSRYTVNSYPDPDSINASLFEVEVDYRGKGRWAVCRHKRCYDRNGVADWEPIPSEREDEWLDRFRFTDRLKAIEVAKKVAAQIIVNGMTARQCWEFEQRRHAEVDALLEAADELPS